MDARDELNLRVLRKQDPSISSIVRQSPYVVLYAYSLESGAWEKCAYEGTLFVYETTAGNRGYRILNRLALECFSKTIESPEDIAEADGYVIHRSTDDDIWGLWIWDENDRTPVFDAMKAATANTTQRHATHGNGFDGRINVTDLFAS